MTVREREVSGVVGHGMALGSDAHAHVRYREVGLRGLGHGDVLDGVALVAFHGFQGIIEQHVGVERVILRRLALL